MVTKAHLAIATFICLLSQFAIGQDYPITQPGALGRIGSGISLTNEVVNDVIYTEYNGTIFSF
jgi:hypothetical protein